MYAPYTNLRLLESYTGETTWRQMRMARRMNGVRRYASIWTYIRCRLIQVILLTCIHPKINIYIYTPGE